MKGIMRFIAPPPIQYRLIKNFPLKLLSASVLLSLGQASFALDNASIDSI